MTKKETLLLITLLAGTAWFGQSTLCAQPPDSLPATETLDTSIHIPLQPDDAVIEIANIRIVGNKKTRPEIIEREISLKANASYKGSDFNHHLRLTREQLMNTRLFIRVNVSWIPEVKRDRYDIVIEVQERWYIFPLPYFKVIDRNWNVWIKEHGASLSRTDYGVKLLHNNTSGRNDKLLLQLINGYNQQLDLQYNIPFVDKKLQRGYNTGLSYWRNRELNYNTDSNQQKFAKLDDFGRQAFRAEFDFSYRPGSQVRWYAKAIYGRESIDSAFFKLNPNFLGGVTSASFFDFIINYQFFNVDYIPFPLRGWFVDLSLQNRFSKSLGMNQLSGRAQISWEIKKKNFLSLQTAFAAKLQQDLPYFNDRLMGYGSLYMQGLEYSVMDGSLGIMGRTTLRRELFTLTLKGPQKWKAYSSIPFRVFAKTYGNLGYAYSKNAGTNYMNNRLLRTAGVGIEIMTIYDFVMKLEYSFNQFGQNGLFIHSSSDF